MKLFGLLLTSAWILGLAKTHADASGDPVLIRPPANIQPVQPVIPPTLPDFDVISTHEEQIIQEEPAPLSDMKPVRKVVSSTVEIVADPHLPPPPAPPPPTDPNDPEVIARRTALRARAQQIKSVFLSATVYDHERTLLKWHLNGKPEQVMTAWSRLDFTCFSGFAKYSYKGNEFSFMMWILNESSVNARRRAARMSIPYQPIEVPEIPADGPGFVIMSGDQTDAAMVDVVTGLHELYRVEGARMEAALIAREEANRVREAELRANPPQPEDVHIRIWKKDVEAEGSTNTP